MKTERDERVARWSDRQLRRELETAWLRGWKTHALSQVGPQQVSELPKQVLQEAADYAERVVGGSTRPAKPDPLPTPSKDENAA